MKRRSAVLLTLGLIRASFLGTTLAATNSSLDISSEGRSIYTASGRVTPRMFISEKVDTEIDDWTPYIQAAIDYAEKSGGGTVFIPPQKKPYPVAGTLHIQKDGVVIEGGGRATILMSNNPHADLLTFEHCSTCGVQDLQISGNVSYNEVLKNREEPYAIVLGRSTNSAFVRHVYIQSMWNGIHIHESDGEDQVTQHVVMSNMAGHYGIRFDGSKSHQSYRATIENFTAGNVPLIDFHSNGTVGARWKVKTAFRKGDVVQSSDGGLWLAQSAAVSGQNEPHGVPGSGATIFNTVFYDGGVSWLYTAGNMSWISFSSYAYSLVVRSTALLGGVHAVEMENPEKQVDAAPKWLFGYDVEGDHNFLTSWDIEAGEAAKCDMCWFGSLTGDGAIYSAETTEGSLVNSRLAYNGGAGIRVIGGTNHIFSHNQIGRNCGFTVSQGDKTCSGVWLGEPVRTTVVTANVIGALGNPLSKDNPQKYGIYFEGSKNENKILEKDNIIEGNNISAENR
ncbi:hypothetical protein ACF3NX_13160 (plasmid) [Acetobacter orientalis]|uniref:hypothetical protein n=1 Tax=Acetobacter orientalis TaxID=146474 RepID=UPI003870BA21